MQDQYDPLAAYQKFTPVESAGAWLSRPLVRAGIVFIALLFVAVSVLYGHSVNYPFVFDDVPFFTEAGLHQYGTSMFHFDLRWLAYASFGWTYELFGMDIAALRWGNILLHGVTASLLFIFFQRMITLANIGTQTASFTAFLLALLFAVHPVASYGVAYLVERSIIMATLFSVATLWCYLEGITRQHGKRWLAAAVVCYFLAVFSKEHSVMLPAVAILLSIWQGTTLRDMLRRYWGVYAGFALIGAFIILRSKGVLGAPYEIYAQAMLAQMSESRGGGMPEHVYALSVISQAYLYFKYLLLWLIPAPNWLAIDLRQHFPAQALAFPELAGFIVFLVYPFIAFYWLRKGGQRGLIGFALLTPWLLFFTELATVRLQEPFVLYRSYLWFSSLPLLIVGLMGVLDTRIKQISIIILCVIFASLAWGRIATFESAIKLWTDAVAKDTDTSRIGAERPYNNLGYAYMQAHQMADAENNLMQALHINPKAEDVNFNMGVIRMLQGRSDEAFGYYDQAIAARDNYRDPILNRGYLKFQLGRAADSIVDYDRAIMLNPSAVDGYLNRGLSYAALGQFDKALADADTAVKLAPANAQAYLNRGIIYAQQRQFEPALADINYAVQLAPKSAEAYYNRGYLALIQGNHDAAARDLQMAVEINPNYPEALTQLATVEILATHYEQALALLNRAVSLQPNAAPLYVVRGAVQAGLAHNDAALADYEHAVQLAPNNTKAQLSKGMLLIGLNRRAEAMPALQAVCQLDQAAACAKARQLMANGR
ncbi:MAG: tetratricopeptide repeat protein [Sulfuriferula sp.]